MKLKLVKPHSPHLFLNTFLIELPIFSLIPNLLKEIPAFFSPF